MRPYAFCVTWLIAKAIDRVIGFRIAPDAEVAGIDLAEHAETAYEMTDASAGAFAGAGSTGHSHFIRQARDDERSE